MKTDEEIVKEWLQFIKTNLHIIAAKLHGNFIDPKVRPKDKRKKFDEKRVMKVLAKRIDELMLTDDVDTWARKKKRLGGTKGWTIECLDNKFAEQRARWVYNKLLVQPDYKAVEEAKRRKERRKRLRAEWHDKDPFHPDYPCFGCEKYLFMYDRKNNKRHKKHDVCTCHSSRVIQGQMKDKISAYRKGLREQRKIPKKDPMRYK